VGQRVINPWTWQDQFGFAQAIEVTGSERALFCAGQTSTDPDGNPLHPGDMRAQVSQALDNLETVLREAGFDLSQVVRLNTYTTDVDALLGSYDLITSRLAEAGCRPSATLLGVARLAFPEYLVELEATAVA
jgi:enamine deaminase RidA (YjgF/YER057c/UK114 family)